MRGFIFLFLTLLSSCCANYDFVQRRLENQRLFQPWNNEFKFVHASGEIMVLISGSQECQLKDPYKAQDCIKYEDEICGQPFVVSDVTKSILDFSLRAEYDGKYEFIFENSSASFYWTSIQNSLQIIELNGVVYDDVILLEPIGFTFSSSIVRFYFSISRGPIKYELQNGQTWTRVY